MIASFLVLGRGASTSITARRHAETPRASRRKAALSTAESLPSRRQFNDDFRVSKMPMMTTPTRASFEILRNIFDADALRRDDTRPVYFRSLESHRVSFRFPRRDIRRLRTSSAQFLGFIVIDSTCASPAAPFIATMLEAYMSRVSLGRAAMPIFFASR